MNDSTRPRVIALTEELDRLVPREGARVSLRQHGGGPDESHIVANELGYLRFGVELLKAAHASPSPAPGAATNEVASDLEYLFTEDSDIGFDALYRSETFDVGPSGLTLRQRVTVGLLQVGCVGLLLAVVALAIMGLVTFASWLF
jgi:hypothetical protein